MYASKKKYMPTGMKNKAREKRNSLRSTTLLPDILVFVMSLKFERVYVVS